MGNGAANSGTLSPLMFRMRSANLVVGKGRSKWNIDATIQRQRGGGQPVKVGGKLLRVAFRVNKMPKNITIQLEDKQQKPILKLFIESQNILYSTRSRSMGHDGTAR
ncbi:hypothetical protein niasHT_005943 [Heterodera trifolii]|uniref:Uncharacterized protein n=1 Tax=Heterodera trifolii TaxID=157864 RepID=A0ABD2MG27_9BILA